MHFVFLPAWFCCRSQTYICLFSANGVLQLYLKKNDDIKMAAGIFSLDMGKLWMKHFNIAAGSCRATCVNSKADS